MIIESPVLDLSEEARHALKQAVEWRLLSLLLERPRAGWHEEVRALAKEVENPQLRDVGADAADATEEAYLAVLGPAGFVSPREVSYAIFEDPGRILADLAAFYQAFAFLPRCEDPEDHIAVQTGFVGYLGLKDAYAQASQNSDAVESTRAALSHFIEAHYARLVHGFAEKLGCNGPAYLCRAVRILTDRVPRVESKTAPGDMDLDPLSGGCPLVCEED